MMKPPSLFPNLASRTLLRPPFCCAPPVVASPAASHRLQEGRGGTHAGGQRTGRASAAGQHLRADCRRRHPYPAGAGRHLAQGHCAGKAVLRAARLARSRGRTACHAGEQRPCRRGAGQQGQLHRLAGHLRDRNQGHRARGHDQSQARPGPGQGQSRPRPVHRYGAQPALHPRGHPRPRPGHREGCAGAIAGRV